QPGIAGQTVILRTASPRASDRRSTSRPPCLRGRPAWEGQSASLEPVSEYPVTHFSRAVSASSSPLLSERRKGNMHVVSVPIGEKEIKKDCHAGFRRAPRRSGPSIPTRHFLLN